MIKELLKDGNRRYFEAEREEGKLIFAVYDWDNNKTLDEIELAFNITELPSYIKENHSLTELINKPLSIFELTIYSFGSELNPKNMSLWEYETFVKGNQEAQKPLKMAFISRPQDEDYFYIACESFDSESMVTRKNMDIVYKAVNRLQRELEQVTNRYFAHVEAY